MGIPYLFPSQQDPSPPVTPPSPPKEDSGGSFWGGVLDLLKNIPITIGGPANKSPISLGSYNQLTAGRRLLDFGRAQGMDVPTGSVSPEEAQFMVGQGMQRRLTAPLGEEFAATMIPYVPGARPLGAGEVGPVLEHLEAPEVQGTRRLLALMPRSAAPALLQDLMTTYGVLPGMQTAPVDTDAPLRMLPSEGQQPVTQTPMALAQPGQASGPTSAVQPATGTREPLPTSAVQPLAAGSGVAAGPSMPQPPAAYSRVVTQEEARAHPSVQAAVQVAQQAPNRKNQQALLAANAAVRSKILAERELAYREDNKNYANTLTAWKTAMEANRPDYGLQPADLNTFVYGRYGLPPGSRPTSAMVQQAQQDKQAHDLAVREAETRATVTAKNQAEEQVREGQTVFDVVGRDPDKLNQYRDKTTAFPLAPDTPYPVARQTGALVSTEQGKRLDDLLDAMPIVERMNAYIQQIYGPGGIYANMSGDERRSLTSGFGRALSNVQQRYPILQEAQAFMEANGEKLARAVGGIRGAGTEGDVRRSKALFPELSSAMGLRWQGWKPIPEWDMPDTRALALGKLNAYNVVVDGLAGKILQNPQFQHPNLLPRIPPQPGRPAGPGTPPPAASLPPVPPVTAKPMPNDQRAIQAAYAQLGITHPPHAGQDPQAFARFLAAVRTQLTTTRPTATPQLLDKIVAQYGRALAQQQGATWPPTP